jgi:PGF-pre-PGF domain-containing protein/PGF-CTERM protein
MKRLLLGVLVVVLVSGAVIGTGAVDDVFTDADDVEIDDNEVVLQPADSPEGDVYADFTATESGEDLRVNISNLNQLATSEVDNVFTATYNGDQEARVHFEDTGSDVTIYDMETGDPVETEDNAVILTPGDDQRTFGVRVTADEETDTAVLDGVTVVARAVNPAFQVNEIETVQDEVTAGEDVTVRATIENTGDGFPRTVTLNATDRENSVAARNISLDADETRTVEFQYSTREGDVGELGFGVDAVDDAIEPTADGAAVVQVAEPTSEFDVSELSLDRDSVTAGSTVTANVTVENVGADEGEGTVEILANGESVSERDLTLDVDETTTIELPYVPTRGVADSDVSIRAQSPTAESTAENVTVNEPVTFDIDDDGIDMDTVTLDEDGEAELTVEPEISNDGTQTGEARVWLEFGTERVAFATEEIEGGDTGSVELTAEIDERDLEGVASADRAVTVFTENAESGDTVTVQRPAAFDVAIDDVTTSAPRGGQVTVDATIENVGGAEETQTVSLDGQGLSAAETEVTLDGDESDTVELTATVEESAAPGETELTVDAGDDEETAVTRILRPPTFDLAIATATDPVFTDETFTTDVFVRNVGGETGEETVELLVDGESVDDATVNVDARGNETPTLEYDVEDAGVEPGTLDIAIEGSDASIDGSVEVREAPDEPFFRVEGATFDAAEVPRLDGEQVNASATVRNTGDETANGTVALTVDGTEFAAEQVELGADEATQVEFSVDATNLSTGDRTFSLGTQDTERTATVTVREPQPATFEAELANVDPDDTLADGDDVAVDITNTGELDGTAAVDLTYGTAEARSFSDTASQDGIDVPAGETERVDLAVDLAEPARAGDFDGEVVLDVTGDDEANASVPVTLEFGTGAGAVETAIGTAADANEPALIGDDPGIDGTVTVDEEGVSVEYVGDGPMDPDVSGTAFEVDASEVELNGTDMTATDATDATGIAVTGDASDVVLDSAQLTEGWDPAIDVSGNGTEIRYANVRDVDDGIVNVGDDLVVRNSQFRSTDGDDGYAVNLTSDGSGNAASNATIRDSNFISNHRALFADAGSHTMDGNNIERNDAAIETVGTESQVFISAPDNWWGSAAGPAVAENLPEDSNIEPDILSNVEFPSPESAPYQDAVFSVAEPESDSFSVTRGETLDIEATVRNDGGTAGTSNQQAIELLVGGRVVDAQTVDGVGANESEPVELSYTPAASEIGDRSATIRSEDDSVTIDISVTEPPEPDDDDAAGDVGGGDGDSAGPAPEPETDTAGDAAVDASVTGRTLSADIESAAAGSAVTTAFGEATVDETIADTGASLNSVTTEFASDVSNTNIEASYSATNPSEDVPGLSAEVDVDEVAYVTVDTTATEDDLEAVTFEFTVSRSELEDAGLDPGEVALYRYGDGEYNEYDATVASESDDRVTYTAEVPGLSVFAIGGETGQVTTTTPAPDTTTPEPDTATPEPDTATPEPDTATPTTTDTGTPGFGPVVAITALLALAFAALRRRA